MRPEGRRRRRLRSLAWLAILIGAYAFLGENHLLVYLVLLAFVTDMLLVRDTQGRTRARRIGLYREVAVRHTGLGFLLGAVELSAVIGVLAVAGWYAVRRVVFRPGDLLYAIAFFACVAFFEEVVFRGLLLRWLERRTGSWAALGISSVLFGAIHLPNPNATVVGAVGIAVAAGLTLGGAYIAWRNLWVPVGIHWSWNLFEGPIYGTPVSGLETYRMMRPTIRGPELWTGGAFGPEAGLAVIIVGTVAGIAFLALAVHRGNLRGPEPRRPRRPSGEPAVEPA